MFSVFSPNDEFEVKLKSLISMYEGISSSLLHEKQIRINMIKIMKNVCF